MVDKIVNSKVFLIDEKGMLYAMGRVNEPKLHVKYLLNYINLKHLNIDTTNLTTGNVRDRFVCQLTSAGDVVYLNEQGYGMFYFPNDLTDEQMSVLCNMDLGNKKVGILYNLKLVGKNMMSKSIGMGYDYNFKEAFEEYINGKSLKKFRR